MTYKKSLTIQEVAKLFDVPDQMLQDVKPEIKINDIDFLVWTLKMFLESTGHKMKKEPLKFLIKCIDLNIMDIVFTEDVFNEELGCYVIESAGYMFSKEFVDDVIKNTDHYRAFIKDEESALQNAEQ